MQRPRLLALVGGIATVVALGPATAAVALAADPTVVVQAGETLTALSERHGLTIERLADLNGIVDPNRIYAGQRLRLGGSPAGTPAVAAPAAPKAAAPAAARIHLVRAGDNLTHIAAHYGVTVAALVSANQIANPSRIFAGQQLTIPGVAAGAGARAAAARTPVAMPATMAAAVRARDHVRRVIAEEAVRYGVPPSFALAVAWQESGWQQGVVSYAGAVGVMQLMPATAEWVGEAMLGARVDIHDTRHNIRAGVRLLAHYLDRYDGNRDLVLAAYYQGQTAVERHGIFAVSRPYIASITALARMFGG